MAEGARKILRGIRKRTRKPRRLLVYLLTRIVARGILLLPDRAAAGLCSRLGAAAYWVLPSRRRRALENLRLSLGTELDERQRRQVARGVFRNCGRSLAEFVLLSRWDKEELCRRVKFVGVENLVGELERGRGALAVLAHFGNWELAAAAGVQCLGLPLAVVARELSNKGLEALLSERRAAAGIEVFMRGRGVRPMIHHLKAGKVLALLVDQDTRKGQGIFIPFFGRPALTQRGPGLLAWRQNVSIVPIAMVRNPDGFTHTLYFEKSIEPPAGLGRDEAVEFLLRSYTAVFERHIRSHPSQWMWMHDRWFHQPRHAVKVRSRVQGLGG